MGFFKKIASVLTGGESTETGNVHWEYIRCSRCKEQIAVRIDLRNELTPQYDSSEGAYYIRKGVVGGGETRCYRTIEVELFFNSDRQLVSRYITGGEFIAKDEFYAQEVSDE